MSLSVTFVPFHALSGAEVYAVIALRERVFVVEQRCAYLDADGLDLEGEHLLMREEGKSPDEHGELVAYVRVLAPGTRFDTFSIGRVVVSPERRGEQLGRRVMEEAITRITAARGPVPITLSAQAHLEQFYASLGFVRTSDVYDEDGIPHVEMRREA